MLVLILDKFLIFVSVAFDLVARELLFVGYTLSVLLSKMSLFMITKSILILCKILIFKIKKAISVEIQRFQGEYFVTKLCDRDNHKKLLPFEKIRFLLIRILVHIHILVYPWNKCELVVRGFHFFAWDVFKIDFAHIHIGDRSWGQVMLVTDWRYWWPTFEIIAGHQHPKLGFLT